VSFEEGYCITRLLELSEGHEIRMFGDLYIRVCEDAVFRYVVGREELSLHGRPECEIGFTHVVDAVEFFVEQRKALQLGFSYERTRG
jgi:hypothetical protein